MRTEAQRKKYCIYSGKYLPSSAMSKEHVVPKSLGGSGNATIIRASKKLNSEFGTEIDGRLMKDHMIQYARMNVGMKGQSRKVPEAVIWNMKTWKNGAPTENNKRYTFTHKKGGEIEIFDHVARKEISSSMINEYTLVTRDLKIEHVARFKFALKTLLGVGWKHFGSDLLNTVDTEFIRRLLSSNLRISNASHEGGISYIDQFLAGNEISEREVCEQIQNRLISEKRSSFLVRHVGGHLEWSVAVLGEYVGTVRVPCQRSLIKQDIFSSGIIRMVVMADDLEIENALAIPVKI